jgi:cyclopropane-fatty-acyl-phospholipid synthase
LALWSERLEARREEAAALAGPERYRIWRVYLPGMALAFDSGWLSVAQVVAYKPSGGRPAARPWTRAHQYLNEPPVLATGLAWNNHTKSLQLERQ